MSKTEHQQRIEQFMEKAGQAVPECPTEPDLETRKLRARLILEEALETINKGLGMTVVIGDGPFARHLVERDVSFTESGPVDLVELADGCADVSVVTIGTMSACGIADQPVLEAVDESNLQKFGPGSHLRDDGKWIKPPDWRAPDLREVLWKQGL